MCSFSLWPCNLVWPAIMSAGGVGRGYRGSCVVCGHGGGEGCVGRALVFVWNSTVPENFNLNFSAVFCYYEKNFCFRLGRGLGIRL